MKLNQVIKGAVWLGWLAGVLLLGQVPVDTSILEGALNGLEKQADGSVIARVMATRVRVTAATRIYTPTANLTLEQLCATNRFPGRTLAGFLGGTVIAMGREESPLLVAARDFFVEPAENVLIGTVTGVLANGGVSINGTPVMRLEDSRIPAHPMRNAFGLEIDPTQIPLGTPATAEGYFDGRCFRSFILDLTGVLPLKDTVNPQIGVTQARCTENFPDDRKGDRVDLLGGVTLFHLPANVASQSVDIYRVDGGTATFLARTTATRDPVQPSLGLLNVRFETLPTTNPVLGRAPTLLKLVMPANGTTLRQPVTQLAFPLVK